MLKFILALFFLNQEFILAFACGVCSLAIPRFIASLPVQA